MSRKSVIIISIFLALLPLLAALQASAEEAPNFGLKISEIKLGGGSDPKEFVELFNSSGETIDLTGLQLDYAKTSFSPSFCSATNWKSHAAPISAVTTKVLSGSLMSRSFVVIEMSLTDNAAGSLRLSTTSETNFTQRDLVGWGSASPCYQATPAVQPSTGQSIKRTFDQLGKLTVSHDNATDFTPNPTPLPGNDQCLLEDCYSEPAPGVPPMYKPAYITELLPDPAAPKTDSSDEFIELYNPNAEAIDLTNYTLHTASQSTTYKKVLADIMLQPGEYLALYSVTTGLSLINGNGYAWLTAPDGSPVDETEWYPDTIAGDQAWALGDTGWQLTDTPTPGLVNQINLSILDATAMEVCPEGKFRNPETGRCKNNVIAAAIQPCKENQERNPATGRCRNVVLASSTACKAGQVRNQTTNRCRNQVAAKSTACAAGYERNAETNRCRKATSKAVKSANTNGDQSNNKINFAIIGGASTALIGYAAYEYRQDMFNYYARVRQRLSRQKKEVVQ